MHSGQRGPDEGISRSDIEALGATRSELGSDYEGALLDSFADRVERTIDERVNRELARRSGYGGHQVPQAYRQPQPSSGSGMQLALGIVSLAAFIPISIVLGVTGSGFALIVTLAAILGVNVAHALHYRRQDPRGR